MLQLETYLHGPNGTMYARVQTTFKMILRTCPNTLRCTQLVDLIQQLQTLFITSWIAYRCSPLMTRLPCELSWIASFFLSIRRQGIINMTCRDSSLWQNAIPAYLFNRMSNEAFTLAYKRRSMRRLMGSRTNYVCGAKIDLFGDHVLVCPRVTVWNQVRNTGHSDFSSSGEVSSHCTHATYPRSASHISLHCWSSCASRSSLTPLSWPPTAS